MIICAAKTPPGQYSTEIPAVTLARLGSPQLRDLLASPWLGLYARQWTVGELRARAGLTRYPDAAGPELDDRYFHGIDRPDVGQHEDGRGIWPPPYPDFTDEED